MLQTCFGMTANHVLCACLTRDVIESRRTQPTRKFFCAPILSAGCRQENFLLDCGPCSQCTLTFVQAQPISQIINKTYTKYISLEGLNPRDYKFPTVSILMNEKNQCSCPVLPPPIRKFNKKLLTLTRTNISVWYLHFQSLGSATDALT